VKYFLSKTYYYIIFNFKSLKLVFFFHMKKAKLFYGKSKSYIFGFFFGMKFFLKDK
jgi:hypothetical protein